MRKLYEQMLEIVVLNPNLLTCHQNDLIVHDQNQLESADVGQQWIWVLKSNGTQLSIISNSIEESIWQNLDQGKRDATCNWGFPYIRAALQNSPDAKTFVLTIEDIQDKPLGTIKEVSHDEALMMLACDRCLKYWQEKYPEHPMHLDLHRLSQSA